VHRESTDFNELGFVDDMLIIFLQELSYATYFIEENYQERPKSRVFIIYAHGLIIMSLLNQEILSEKGTWFATYFGRVVR
jgi:hypothetical protein